MSAKQWQITYYIIFAIYVAIFAFCIFNHWEMVAWLVVCPVGLIVSFVLRKKKNPN